jgi:hypothetical protein
MLFRWTQMSNQGQSTFMYSLAFRLQAISINPIDGM